MPLTRNITRAFTLIEIMIVVSIIGILLSIALPNFYYARQVANAKRCIKQLQLIDSAVEQWAMDNHATASTSPPTIATLCGTSLTTYIKTMPICPEGGTYSIAVISLPPTCTVGGTGPTGHTLP